MKPDLIGWASSLVLLATLSVQTYKSYKVRSNTGVSKWLYIGELVAASGFTVYSAMLRNAVFVTTNALGVVTSVIGIALYVRNRRATARRSAWGASRPLPAH